MVSMKGNGMTESDIYRTQNLGNRIYFGERGALLIVDFVNGFNDARVLGGGNIPDAIAHTKSLLKNARDRGLPVVFTRIVYEPGSANVGAFAKKIPSLTALTEDNPASHVIDELAPQPGEYVLRKTQASAFFGTDLASWLQWRRIDTLLVTGCTTSGCVRASVIDAASHNFRTIVIRDCVGDRAIAPHEANLFDMDQKYADVVSIADAKDWMFSGDVGGAGR
jgi:maleamate amidohydrolase